jgi:NAD(P)-dependent dehydrogenase (short-subunit alcohol dehydrogenase family)
MTINAHPRPRVGNAEDHTLSFDGTVVLITGAGRGLGRAYASLLVGRGAKVIINDLGIETDGAKPSREPAERTAAELREAGGAAVADTSDISTERGAAAAVNAALKHFGRLDAVINNAGFVRKGRFGNMKLADLDQMLAVHVRGAFLVTSAAWKVMTQRRYGRVVMTTSCGGLYGQDGLAAYGAAKGAIVGLTRVLALEGEAVGIRVNSIAPLAYTRLAADIPDAEHRALFERNTRVEQVAPLVGLLAHRQCPVNGQIFDAGAGRFARIFIGEGTGYLDVNPTIESVRDHFDEVLADRDYSAPRSANDTVARTVALIAGKRPRGFE